MFFDLVSIIRVYWIDSSFTDCCSFRQLEEPAANPIEKAILWRLLKLMRLNIQPIFIFDGPSRPWKRGGVAGRIDWEKIRLLRQMLDVLKVPHHRAPAEAEAECAQLQKLGIVDAVWTDDGDTLMFGATMLIRNFKDEKKGAASKSDTHVRIYRAEQIRQQFRVDREGLVLFAMLSGGDYDTRGLPGCGHKASLEAAQWQNGYLGQLLCEVPLKQLRIFTDQLRNYFDNNTRSSVTVPADFPRDLHVRNYRSPKVSTEEQCRSLRALKDGWEVAIDESKLRPCLRERFNFNTKEYLSKIVPVLLVKRLAQTAPDEVLGNKMLDIRLIHKRGKTADDYKVLRLLAFDPHTCSSLDLKNQPMGEDWNDNKGNRFNPSEPVEMELLNCILERGLGRAEIEKLQIEPDANKSKSQKRKSTAVNADADVSSSGATPKPATKKTKTSQESTHAGGSASQSTQGEAKPSKSMRKTLPKEDTDAITNTSKTGKKAPQKAVEPAATPLPKFRMPSVFQKLTPKDHEQLRQEGIHAWGPDNGQQAISDSLRHRESAPTSGPPATKRNDSGVVLGVTTSDADSHDKAGINPSLHPMQQLPSANQRLVEQEERIQELFDDVTDNYKQMNLHQLPKEQKRVDAALRLARKCLTRELKSDGERMVNLVHEAFGRDNAEVATSEAQQRRKTVYKEATQFLTVLRAGIRDHTEAFANVCAMKSALSPKTGLSARLLDHQQDHAVLQAAARFEFEIETALPRDDNFSLPYTYPLVAPLLESLAQQFQSQNPSQTDSPSNITPNNVEVRISPRPTAPLKPAQGSTKGKEREAMRSQLMESDDSETEGYPTPRSEAGSVDDSFDRPPGSLSRLSNLAASYYGLESDDDDDDDDDGDLRRAMQLSAMNHSSGVHGEPSRSAFAISGMNEDDNEEEADLQRAIRLSLQEQPQQSSGYAESSRRTGEGAKSSSNFTLANSHDVQDAPKPQPNDGRKAVSVHTSSQKLADKRDPGIQANRLESSPVASRSNAAPSPSMKVTGALSSATNSLDLQESRDTPPARVALAEARLMYYTSQKNTEATSATDQVISSTLATVEGKKATINGKQVDLIDLTLD